MNSCFVVSSFKVASNRRGANLWKTAFSAIAGGVVGGGVVWFLEAGPLRLVPVGMSYAELAATLLASVAVLLAILGFFIAVLAVLGLSQFRGMVRKAATDTAKDHIDERLLEGDLKEHFENTAASFLNTQFKSGTLRRLIEERIDQVVYGGSAQRAEENDGNQTTE